jgi:hypothetical protein
MIICAFLLPDDHITCGPRVKNEYLAFAITHYAVLLLKIKREEGQLTGYGWTRTTDLSIMSAAL